MCFSCGCSLPTADHGDVRHITALVLQGAADAIGATVPDVVHHIFMTMAGAAPYSEVDTTLLSIKELDSNYAATRLVKATEEQRYTLGVAYPAHKADVRRAADGFRDFVPAEVLEKTAWNWMQKHRDISLFHKGGTSGHGTVVESYIYQGPDWEQPSPVDGKLYVIKKGDWLMGCIWDAYGWTLVKAGLVNGWSPEGGAKRHLPSPEELASLRR